MTIRAMEARLRRIEVRRNFRGDIASASDQQLMALLRSGYADLRAEHGSLAEAARHLRDTGNPDAAALATFIEEDIGGPDARFY